MKTIFLHYNTMFGQWLRTGTVHPLHRKTAFVLYALIVFPLVILYDIAVDLVELLQGTWIGTLEIWEQIE